MALDRSRRARAARRRTRRMKSVEHDLSPEQWAALVDAWGGCAYCGATGTALQRDCVLPISRGGRYTIDNIAPACRSCNASKCNDEVTGWLRRKRLDERAFLERHLAVQRALAARFAEAPVAAPPDPPDGDLWARVGALPQRQRDAVVLRFVGDLDHRAVAAALGTSPGMSRRLVSDAVATLRLDLRDQP